MLKLDGVTTAYGPVEAISDLSFEVQEGEVFALLGPNGAGKTTTLLSIMGVVKPTKGRIMFRDRVLNSLAIEDIVRAGVALVPEGRRVFSSLSVEENLWIGGASQHASLAETQDRLDELGDLFPVLGERRLAKGGQLSGGEQQQLAIARALMSEPEMLMLDEPSLGLAPTLVEGVFDLISHLANSGITVLLVEQNAHMALELADSACLLVGGKIEFLGAAKSLESSSLFDSYVGGFGSSFASNDPTV